MSGPGLEKNGNLWSIQVFTGTIKPSLTAVFHTKNADESSVYLNKDEKQEKYAGPQCP